MKLNIKIDTSNEHVKPRMTPCEKAHRLIEKVDSARDESETEWEILKETFKRVKALPNRTGEMKMLYEMLIPIIDKYADFDTKDGDIMDAIDYMSQMEPEEEEEA